MFQHYFGHINATIDPSQANFLIKTVLKPLFDDILWSTGGGGGY